MAANDDFLKVMFKDVTLLWPKLDQPYRYNNQTKRSEPCAATATNAAFSVACEMPKGEAKPIYEALRSHYEKAKASNPKLPAFSKVFGMKRDDEKGTVQFTFKRRAVKGNGEVNTPPRVIDGQRQDLAEKNIWTGSKGTVRALAFPIVDPDGAGGISLLFDVVQVTHAVYGGDNLEDDFAIIAPTVQPIDDFDEEPKAPPAHVVQAQAKAAAAIPDDAAW